MEAKLSAVDSTNNPVVLTGLFHSKHYVVLRSLLCLYQAILCCLPFCQSEMLGQYKSAIRPANDEEVGCLVMGPHG